MTGACIRICAWSKPLQGITNLTLVVYNRSKTNESFNKMINDQKELHLTYNLEIWHPFSVAFGWVDVLGRGEGGPRTS